MSSSHTTLSAAADDRKARLAKLKSLKRKQPQDEIVPPESERASPSPPSQDVATLHLSGRNYDPETKGPKLGFEAPPSLGPDEQTLEEQAAGLEADIKRAAEEDDKENKGIDLFKLQPKKPNWDLKRELDKKLEVLRVRTDNAIARMVRERLQAKSQEAQQSDNPAAKDGDASGPQGAELEKIIQLREEEDEEQERRERESLEV